MSDIVEYRLANVGGLTRADIDAALAEGARFVMFEYAVSFIAGTWARPSSVWFVRGDEEARRLARRFSLPTAILGWWCIPHGPMKTLRALRINRGGGAVVTDEILPALTDEALTSGVIRFTPEASVPLVFDAATPADRKDLLRALRPVLERHPEIGGVLVGRRFVEDLRPHVWPFAIILETSAPVTDELRAELTAPLKKVFRDWVVFEIDAIDDVAEPVEMVRLQCDRLYER